MFEVKEIIDGKACQLTCHNDGNSILDLIWAN